MATVKDHIISVLEEDGGKVERNDLISEVLSRTDKAERTVINSLTTLFNAGEIDRPEHGFYTLLQQGDGARIAEPAREHKSEKPASLSSEAGEEMLTYKFLDGGPEAGSGGVQYDSGNRVTAPRELAAQWGSGRVIGPSCAYWTRVQGESMEPWLPDQTPIFVEALDEFKDGGRYVVWLGDTQADVVKRVERLNSDAIRMISDNGSFPDRTLHHLEGDTYEDRTADLKLRLRIRGRVLYPRDTGQSIMQAVTEQAGKIARQQSAGLAEGIGRA